MAMWPAYIQALPVAAIVFDKLLPLRSTLRADFGWLSPCGRLHLKWHLNEAVDKVRRQEHRQLSAAGNPSLKGSKYLWLKRPQDLCRRAAVEFRSLLGQDLRTGTAWALKENFDRFWKYTSLTWAMKFPWDWLDAASATGLTPLTKAADLIEKHAEGLLYCKRSARCRCLWLDGGLVITRPWAWRCGRLWRRRRG